MKRVIITTMALSLAGSGFALAQGGANQTGPTGTLGTTMGGSYGAGARNSGSPINGMPNTNGKVSSDGTSNSNSPPNAANSPATAGTMTQQPSTTTGTNR